MVKKKRNKVLIGSIIIILTIASVFGFLAFSDDGVEPLSISFVDKPLTETPYPLNFCNSEESCYNYLSQQGMPSDFLQLNGYTITCQNGNCYAKKI